MSRMRQQDLLQIPSPQEKGKQHKDRYDRPDPSDRYSDRYSDRPTGDIPTFVPTSMHPAASLQAGSPQRQYDKFERSTWQLLSAPRIQTSALSSLATFQRSPVLDHLRHSVCRNRAPAAFPQSWQTSISTALRHPTRGKRGVLSTFTARASKCTCSCKHTYLYIYILYVCTYAIYPDLSADKHTSTPINILYIHIIYTYYIYILYIHIIYTYYIYIYIHIYIYICAHVHVPEARNMFFSQHDLEKRCFSRTFKHHIFQNTK